MPQYVKTVWVNGTVPALNDSNLNKMEQGIFDAFRQDGSTTMSGQLVTTAGSAATPAIAPTGDSNTGIFFPAADTIAFGEGGTEAMRITSAGNVGIGTTSPTEKLQVNATSGNTGLNINTADSGAVSYISLSNTGASGKRYSLNVGGNTIGSGLSNNLFLYDNDNAAVRFLITPSGNVGIGTTSPSEKLVVNGNISSLYGIHSTTLYNGNLNFYNAGSATKYINVSDDASTIPAISLDKIGSATKTCFLNGNVGIGTTSPSNYSGRASVGVNGTDGGIFECMVGGTVKFQIYPESSVITDSIVLNASGANGYMRFQTYNSEKMRLNNNGYLLIGYTSSNGAYPLQVNGQIFATSSTIATSDGRYKKDVVALDGALDIVKALNPVQFSWKDHPVHKFNTDVPTVGFIAQEVEQVLADKSYLTSIIKKSECSWETETGEFVEREVTRDVEKQITREVEREVTETIDGEEVTRTITEEVTEKIIEQVTEIVTEPVKETHTEEFLGIAESNLIAILTKAVKELAAEVEALKAQLNGN